MVSTYLSSKAIIDSILANPQFINLATKIVNLDKGTPEYLATYEELNALLISLGVTQRTGIYKSDGGNWWYSNLRKPDDSALLINKNTEPEVFSALNYAFGNPICNKKIYPIELQSSISSGYSFAERRNSNRTVFSQFTAKTYKPTSSPLSTNVFTLKVIQDIQI